MAPHGYSGCPDSDAAGVRSQQAYIKASNTDAGHWFSFGVVLSGDTALIGARLDDDVVKGIDSGSAYVFTGGLNPA